MVKEIVRRIEAVESLPLNAARKRDIGNLTEAIHNGFGAALLILELDNADQFLKKSAALFEQMFKIGSTRKSCRKSINRKRMTTTNVEALPH